MVQVTNRGPERGTEDDDDRGAGAQAVDRAVAPRHHGRSAGRHRATTGSVTQALPSTPATKGHPASAARRGEARLRHDAPADDDPRWRQSEHGYGCNAAERMDPPPRSPSTEADDCFMVRIQMDPTEYKLGRCACRAAKAGSPRIIRRASRPIAASLPSCSRPSRSGLEAPNQPHRWRAGHP